MDNVIGSRPFVNCEAESKLQTAVHIKIGDILYGKIPV
jgi:hypothetical protein